MVLVSPTLARERKLRAVKIGGTCEGGTCPTLWRLEDGRVAVQGFAATDPELLAQLDLPAGESVVIVPPALLEAFAR
ncbi:hypothetical protein [Actinomadura flavalba]|uniref:hypothetical protein n=1 Tax=Actinomadura flavalba TaxID=1120938 RepID=UPI0003701BEB|nr:hypothetical protein [Actinomadura flavalba]